jgi:hypothetical protein
MQLTELAHPGAASSPIPGARSGIRVAPHERPAPTSTDGASAAGSHRQIL